MPRKAIVLNSLTRGRIRASWNKHNLYNLYKKGRIYFQGKNLYQQKWTSKQETRAYHGEFLTESRFQTDFSSKLESVANLDDSLNSDDPERRVFDTPYNLQTYAVLEKRLDFALFRAMFASSVRQARQFVLHGSVCVNGINICDPGYTLKAGDIFNIEPEKALYALGAFKPSLKQALDIDQTQVRKWNSYVTRAINDPKKVWEEHEAKKELKAAREIGSETDLKKMDRIKTMNESIEKKMLTQQKAFTRAKALQTVLELGLKSNELSNYQTIFNEQTAEKAQKLFSKITTDSSYPEFDIETLPKIEPADLQTQTETFLSRKSDSFKTDTAKKSFSELKQLISAIQNVHHEYLRSTAQSRMVKINDPSVDLSSLKLPYDPNWTTVLRYHKTLAKTSEILANEKQALSLASGSTKPSKLVNLPWQKGIFGHEDPSKAYFTPWKLRPFIAPFAVLPHHLEISFKTCHAVYLRDPVSMAGKSEVISPFGEDVHERAYMWYIRRAKNSNQ